VTRRCAPTTGAQALGFAVTGWRCAIERVRDCEAATKTQAAVKDRLTKEIAYWDLAEI
jgi:hypothetical protein